MTPEQSERLNSIADRLQGQGYLLNLTDLKSWDNGATSRQALLECRADAAFLRMLARPSLLDDVQQEIKARLAKLGRRIRHPLDIP